MTVKVTEIKNGVYITQRNTGIYLTKQEASELSHALEALLQDMENHEAGLCPKCKGSCENMDGTPCDACEGKGVIS